MSSDIRRLIIQTYQEYVRNHPRLPKELKRALKTHERVPTFVNRLQAQIAHVPGSFGRDTIVQLTRDLSELFILKAEQHLEERIMSPLAKSLLVKKQDEANQFRQDVLELEAKGKTHVQKTEKGIVETTTTEV